MKRLFLTLIFFGLASSILLRQLVISPSETDQHALEKSSHNYQRIISFLPSITEILFALDVEDRVVGVTRYCQYPPEAQEKKAVGGVLDTNFEAVYNLEPDLLIMPVSESDHNMVLKEMGLKTLQVETRSVTGILESIRLIGAAVHREERAAAIIADIEQTVEYIKNKTKNKPKPRVLITFLRPLGERHIEEVYIAGNHTFFNDLIDIAGGTNAYTGSTLITSPIVSPEGILKMNPDVIIEIMSRLHETEYSVEDVLQDWAAMPAFNAYQNKRIYIFAESFVGIPGPRLAQTLEKIAQAIHPDIVWEQP